MSRSIGCLDPELKIERLEANFESRIGGLTRAKAAGLFCLAVLGWVSPQVFSGLLKVCLLYLTRTCEYSFSDTKR